MVVAESRYVAEDALELSRSSTSRFPRSSTSRALEEGSPLVHDDAPGNVAAHLVQSVAIRMGLRRPKWCSASATTSSAAPAWLETRGVLARFDPRTRELAVWDTTQMPPTIRGSLGSLFEIPYNKVRVIAPDMGGGFGTK